jgi:hypothetical protein
MEEAVKARWLGLLILLVAVGAGLYYQFVGFGKPLVVLTGFSGSEKSPLLEDPAVVDLLKSRFGLQVQSSKAGSIEMVTDPRYLKNSAGQDVDFLWPSSQVGLELYKLEHPEATVKSELILNSPLVVYTWQAVADALLAQGVVRDDGGVLYLTDLRKVFTWMAQGKKWTDLGLTKLYGQVLLVSSDPTKSNSGNLFAGLMAATLASGNVTPEALDTVLPQVQGLFAKMGYLEPSTGYLFEQYLNKGMGAFPMIIGYENQLVEFSLQFPELWTKIQGKLRLVYLDPTVWSSHPMLFLTTGAQALGTALRSPELQKVAWEKHGFRSGAVGQVNDPKAFQFPGIAEEITQVIPLPSAQVMLKITQALTKQE